jgi:NADH dehydrogenase
MYQLHPDHYPVSRVPSTANRPGDPVRICVLGGGFGGLYTALALSRKRSPRYQITLVEQRDHFLFTPLLYEIVTGELQAWEIAPTYQKLLRHRQVEHCQARVQDIDLRDRQVYLHDGRTLSYDYLVLALGSESRLNVVPGALEYAQTFCTLADAEHLKERLRFLEASGREVIRVAIAGAGPNGVEIACKLADRLGQRGDVHLIDRGNGILKSFPKGCQVAAARALAKRNVRLHLETSIEAIAPDHVAMTTPTHYSVLPTDLVLWTAGTQISQWIRQLDCAHNPQGQLMTTPTLQLVDHPDVFVLGDVAEIRDISGQRVPAVAQAAFQQAPHTANNLRRAIAGRPPKPFRYLPLGEMLTLGINSAVVFSFGITLDGELARIIRRATYIQRLPTARHGLQVAWRWLVDGLRRRWWKRPHRASTHVTSKRITSSSR